MKNRRSKRITLGVIVVGFAVVMGLGIAYRKPILDHIKAWHFQLLNKTETIEPRLRLEANDPEALTKISYADLVRAHAQPGDGKYRLFLFWLLADYSGYPVIIDPSSAYSTAWGDFTYAMLIGSRIHSPLRPQRPDYGEDAFANVQR